MKELNVYLSGEIHTDWRDQIVSMTKKKGLNVQFTSPVTIHENSDDCGVFGKSSPNISPNHPFFSSDVG